MLPAAITAQTFIPAGLHHLMHHAQFDATASPAHGTEDFDLSYMGIISWTEDAPTNKLRSERQRKNPQVHTSPKRHRIHNAVYCSQTVIFEVQRLIFEVLENNFCVPIATANSVPNYHGGPMQQRSSGGGALPRGSTLPVRARGVPELHISGRKKNILELNAVGLWCPFFRGYFCLPFSKHPTFCKNGPPEALFINYLILPHIALGHNFESLILVPFPP